MHYLLHTGHNLQLVALSVVISILASYTALDLAGRVTVAEGCSRLGWLVGGATAMGTGIWAMHFIGMLAFRLPLPVYYDYPTVVWSILPAVVASGIAFHRVSRPHLQGGQLFKASLFLGAGIVSMHYLGMAAMRLSAGMYYVRWVVILSFIIAVSVAFTGLFLVFKFQRDTQDRLSSKKIWAAILMGLAVPTMHYTAMSAAKFTTTDASVTLVSLQPSENVGFLVMAVVAGTFVVLGIALLTAFFDRRLATQRAYTNALKESQQYFTTILRGIQVGVLVVSADNQITLSNRALLSLLGLSTEAELHDLWSRVLATRLDAQSFFKSDNQLVRSLQPILNKIAAQQPVENAVVYASSVDNPMLVSLLVNAVPLSFADQPEVQMVCTFSEITALTRTENRLKESEVRLKRQAQALQEANSMADRANADLSRLNLQLVQAAQRERTTTQVIQRMRQSLDLKDIFQVTTQEVRQVLNCDRVITYRFNKDWSGDVIAEAVGAGWRSLLDETDEMSPWRANLLQTDRCTVRLLSVGSKVIEDTYLQEHQGGIYAQGIDYIKVDDIYTQGFSPCYVELLESLQARAYVIVTIYANQRLWGLLACYQNDAARHWEDDETQMIARIGAQLGVAIQQAELFHRTRQQAHELKQAKEAADRANQAKSEFLSSMSHELRTPLNAILGFTQLIQQDNTLPERHRRFIDIINSSGEHLLGLINNVLEMSKIEAGELSLNPEVFDLSKLLQSLHDLLKLKAHSKGLVLEVVLSPALPEYVFTDQGKLRQILLNLLGNGIKFTKQGYVRLSVLPAEKPQAVKADSPNAVGLTFIVEDTGVGIAPDEIEAVFKPFQQTQSGVSSGQGTGLGIALSQQYIQLMGGNLSVESTLGQGSCFRFTIQAERADLPQVVHPVRQTGRIVGLAKNQPCYRLLIVEDNPINQLLLRNLLAPLGFDIQEASNGQEAFTIWEYWQPDLIWMDMRMPVMDGYEATRRIRAAEQARQLTPTVIIALTATAFEERRPAILAAGCNEMLRKPFKAQALFDAMGQHLKVEYRYESSPASDSSPDQPRPQSFDPALLTVMPNDWRVQLRQSAARCSDTEILALIQQIPPDQTALVEGLKHLVGVFQFDHILQLIDALNE